ncbi:uncharacterized protein LOC119068426 isoform X3 [Bradysia coprophila]|uniref:uncharacterized protein LOC119068426 isoform X3 n=1 Tax=Bradysia coprophila TaxID=38358 RepID=UPI00187D7ED0|nr:uncharacterized protein LOC119068426 isoform X3 [Bradysia coprophila]
MKSALEKITNVQLNHSQWVQSSLPVNLGGLGIRSLLDISLPAFLSSVYGVKDFVSTLISLRDYESEIAHFTEALSRWSELNEDLTPENLRSQFNWDQINSKRVASSLSFPNDTELYRFQLLQNKMSGAWLNVVPSPCIGTLMNNDVFRTCVGLRLGTKICHPFVCICGTQVDSLGLASINRSSLLEPPGLFRDDGKKRPDGITYTAWEKGKALVWDATCADSLAASNMAGRTKTPGMASVKAANRKHAKYSKLKRNYHFVAFAVESLGPWAKESVDLLNKIGANLIRTTGEPKSRTYLFQRVSLAIQHRNAMCIISSIPKSTPMEEVYFVQ